MPRKKKITQYLSKLPKGFRRFKDTYIFCNKKGIVISEKFDKVRVLKGTISSSGYHAIHMCIDGVRTKIPVHDIVTYCWIGPKQKGLQVNHKNGVKLDNHASNLEYCTNAENIQHAVRTGLKTGDKGTDNGMSILTDADVRKIRELYKTIKSQYKIAEMFSVSRSNIGLIVTHKTWTHI